MKPKPIKFFNLWLTTAQIAHRHGLSVTTVQTRYAQGWRDAALVAPAHALPRIQGGQAVPSRPKRALTPALAAYALRRAVRRLELAEQRLADARTGGRTTRRLEIAATKAEQRRMVCTERLRIVEESEL